MSGEEDGTKQILRAQTGKADIQRDHESERERERKERERKKRRKKVKEGTKSVFLFLFLRYVKNLICRLSQVDSI